MKPDGSLLLPAPGLSITLTNVEEPDNQVTVHNDSAWQEKPLPDGTTLLVVPGQVLSWPPLQLLVGRHTALFDSEGEFIEEVSSQGKEVDLCARLA
jgi:hypothetical protein